MRIVRGSMATVGLAVVTCVVWRLAISSSRTAATPAATVDDLVAATASIGLLLVAAWVWVALIAHVAAALPGVAGRISAAVATAVTPAACRGVIRIVLGATAISAVTPVAASSVEPAAYTLTVDRTPNSPTYRGSNGLRWWRAGSRPCRKRRQLLHLRSTYDS